MNLQKDAVPTRVTWWICLKMPTQSSEITILMQFVVKILTLLCSDDSIKTLSPRGQTRPEARFPPPPPPLVFKMALKGLRRLMGSAI